MKLVEFETMLHDDLINQFDQCESSDARQAGTISATISAPSEGSKSDGQKRSESGSKSSSQTDDNVKFCSNCAAAGRKQRAVLSHNTADYKISRLMEKVVKIDAIMTATEEIMAMTRILIFGK